MKFPERPRILDKVFDPPLFKSGIHCPLCRGGCTIVKGNGARDICPSCDGQGKFHHEDKERFESWIEEQRNNLIIDQDFARREYETQVKEYRRRLQIFEGALDKLTSEEVEIITEFILEQNDPHDYRYY